MNKYPLNKIDYYNNFNDCLCGMAEKFGAEPAITTYTSNGEAIIRSYSLLASDAEAFGNALCRAGMQNKHIAIAAENCYEWLVAFYGVTSIGSVAVMVDIEQSVNTIKRMIDVTDSVAVVASATIVELLGGDYPLPIITIGNEVRGEEWEFEKFCDNGRNVDEAENGFEHVEILGTDTAAIAFTSGTLSTAKAVMLSQRGLLQNAIEAVEMVDLGKKVYSSLPLYHTYGLTCCVLDSLIMGSNVCINGDMKTMMRDLKLFDPVTLMAVPLIAETLQKLLVSAIDKADIKVKPAKKKFGVFRKTRYEEPNPYKEYIEIKKQILGGMSNIICGGAHLPGQVARQFAQFGINVLQGYGITECSPLISVNRNNSNVFGSVGQILPGLEIKLVDSEVLVRGETVMKGYYKDEELTKTVLNDGWFSTGDLGRIDKQGYLYIEGRKKNLIVLKNGKKIAPEEIELHVREIPIVNEVMAYGAVSGDSTDDVRLAIMVYPDEKATEGMSAYEILEELQKSIDKMNAEYPSYKQVKMINLREKEFEKTSSKKIKRQIV